MYVDSAAVAREFTRTAGEARTAISNLAQLTGGINPRSPKQVAEFLYDTLKFDELRGYSGDPIRTGAGGRKTDESTVLALKPSNARQRAFIQAFTSYTPLKKRLETLTKLKACADNEKILLASFNQCVTDTGRLSSSGLQRKVQFQNIDRDLKRLFVPRTPGWKIGDSDAPQLEFRVAGAISNDQQLALDVRSGFDVHTNTGRIIFGKETLTKAERTAAKSHTFKPLYGGKSGTKPEKRYYKAFQDRYHELHKVQEGWTYEVLANKQLRIPSGLIFYWPDTEVYDSGYIKNTTKIYNYPIQSFATADIIPITLVYMWYRMKCSMLSSFIVNTVHDSIIAEVAPGEEDAWLGVVRQAYTVDVFDYLDRVYGYVFSLPLGVSTNIGEYWGDGKEELFEVDGELFFQEAV